jgi:hypothetical protein
MSIGYAYAQYQEAGLGRVPFGLYSSLASAGRKVGFEADLGYHRHSDDFFADAPNVVLETLTVCAGPRFERRSGGARPFVHLLGGLRVDRVDEDSNVALGGMMGGGIDIPVGRGLSLRLSGDIQAFLRRRRARENAAPRRRDRVLSCAGRAPCSARPDRREACGS